MAKPNSRGKQKHVERLTERVPVPMTKTQVGAIRQRCVEKGNVPAAQMVRSIIFGIEPPIKE